MVKVSTSTPLAAGARAPLAGHAHATRYRGASAGLLLPLLAVLSGACAINERDIETWKGTVKGPGKIVAVLQSGRYALPLRSQAALALVEVDRSDIDGVVELNHALQTLPEARRSVVLGALVPRLVEVLRAGHKPDEEVSAVDRALQVRAKDAAYMLVNETPAADRAVLVEAMTGWYAADFDRRALAGNHSVEQVMRRLGPESAMDFVEAMRSDMPAAALVKATQLIAEVGNEDARKKAATKLVALFKEMSSEAYMKRLEGRVKEQVERTGGDTSEARIKSIAKLNQVAFVIDGALGAMKHVSSHEPVRSFLKELAFSDATGDEAQEMRKQALASLANQLTESSVEPLLALATNEAQPSAVRDLAFDRLADLRSLQAVEALWPLVESASDNRVRWRAAEIALASGGTKGVPTFFDKLPDGPSVGYTEDELEMYVTRLVQLSPSPKSEVIKQLRSPKWFNRVIALRFLAREGSKEQLAAVERLTNDAAKPRGDYWDPELTVGKIAKGAVAELKSRTEEPKS